MRWVVVGACAILAFDALGAWASGALDIEYGDPVGLLVSTFLYAAPSFMAARDHHRIRAGTATGAAVAAVDATLGWGMSSALGVTSIPTDLPTTLVVVALVVGVGALVGLLAGVLAIRLARRANRRPDSGE